MKDAAGTPDATEAIATGVPHAAEGRRGPTWRGWVLSILVAILLSVTVALLLGGFGAFRSDHVAGAGSAGSGAGSSCCPPTFAGK